MRSRTPHWPGFKLRGKTPLELRQTREIDGDPLDGPPSPSAIHRLEGDQIAAHLLSRTAPPSRLRYFLDGTQRTFDHYIPGYFPIAFSVVAAATLKRDENGNPSVVPGTLQLRHTWFIPKHAPRQPDLVTRIQSQFENEDILDPLEIYEHDESTYALALTDYAYFVEKAFDAAGKVRDELEKEVFSAWASRADRDDDPNWIVVDGPLNICAPRSIGIVKTLRRQLLTGDEAIALYDLPSGHRTSAFQTTNRYRSDDDLAGLGDDVRKRTLWYIRLNDAAGQDARHGLVRVETDPRVTTPEEIDMLSCWLLAEKRPRSNDARWANLLYPVHILENILKQYVDREYGIAARLVR